MIFIVGRKFYKSSTKKARKDIASTQAKTIPKARPERDQGPSWPLTTHVHRETQMANKNSSTNLNGDLTDSYNPLIAELKMQDRKDSILDKPWTTTLREQWKIWGAIGTIVASLTTIGLLLKQNGDDIAVLKCYNKVMVLGLVLKEQLTMKDVEKCDPDLRSK
jgi:hypothetical protein